MTTSPPEPATATGPPPEPALLTRASPRGRLTLAALTLGSGVAILDGSIVNVALRSVGTDLGASMAQLQWVVGGYLLALASLVLVGGALGDRLGRRRVYLVGMTWFGLASLACALAQTPGQLVALRTLQGVGAALLTPGALALIQASYVPADRASAIGTWAGMSGLGAAAGPLLGGWIVEHASWRWIFGINVPFCVAVVLLTRYAAPESRSAHSPPRFDWAGAGLSVVALGALTQALTGAAESSRTVTWGLVAVSVATAVAFVVREARVAYPLVDLALFTDRVFSACNAMTLLVYGALGAVFLLLVLQLQTTSGWSPLVSGLAGLPVTVALMLLSSRAARLGDRIGPRVPMTVGPLACAAGVALLVPVGVGSGWGAVLPGMVVFALGLALLVSPLTATVLAAAPAGAAGVASGINNAVARAGSLLTVAALPALVGLTGDAYRDPAAMTSGYRLGMIGCAALLAAGGVVSWFGLGGSRPIPGTTLAPTPTPTPTPAAAPAPASEPPTEPG